MSKKKCDAKSLNSIFCDLIKMPLHDMILSLVYISSGWEGEAEKGHSSLKEVKVHIVLVSGNQNKHLTIKLIITGN